MPERRCAWPEGCTTILADHNKTNLCSLHQRRDGEKAFAQQQGQIGAGSSRSRVMAPAAEPNSTVERVLEMVCVTYRVTIQELLEECYRPEVSLARHVAAYILKNDLNRSLLQVASDLRLRSHVSVMHACKKVAKLKMENHDFSRNLEMLRAKCTGPA